MQRSKTKHQAKLHESNWREGEGNIRARDIKVMMEKCIETTEPSLWKLMNPRPTAVEFPWDRTRPSICGRQW